MDSAEPQGSLTKIVIEYKFNREPETLWCSYVNGGSSGDWLVLVTNNELESRSVVYDLREIAAYTITYPVRSNITLGGSRGSQGLSTAPTSLSN